MTRPRYLITLGSALLVPCILLSQGLLPIPGVGAIPVADILSELRLADEVIAANSTAMSTGQSLQWWTQVVGAAQMGTWQTGQLGAPQVSQAANQMGETTAWNPAIATGLGGAIGWSNATVALSRLAGILAGLGTGNSAQLATSEVINAAGANNLNIIGTARAFLSTNAPQMAQLQAALSNGDPGNSGPTQQLAFVANSQAQSNNIQTQQLQVSTATLETLTGLAKIYSDTATVDNNSQANIAIYNAIGPQPQGFAAAFAAEN